MLIELRVRNLGVIEDLTVALGPGMTVLTGETGAGKTLLVEALQLVLGGRAAPGLVRRGADEALVEARFLVSGPSPDANGDAEREVTLVRSIPAEGRARAWVDGRAAPLTALAASGSDLVDIHGQRDHQSLRTAAAQRRALDLFAGTDLSPLRAARRRLEEIDRQLAELGGDPGSRAREADLLAHQVGEIESAGLADPLEEDRLAEEQERLADLEALRSAAAGALDALDAGSEEVPGAIDLVGRARQQLGGRRPFDAWEARLQGVQAELGDLAGELRHARDTWDDDPQRLADVMGRRRLLADLRHKYGATLSEVRAFGAAAAARLDQLTDADQAARVLAGERTEASEVLVVAEDGVRAARRAAAPSMAAEIERHLGDLAMAGARVEVTVAGSGTGEPVEFLLGANRGEELLPLARVASGGELARAMLAVRLVAMDGPATMVFDEVDAGVGGAAALALGRALRQAAEGRQVLVVTHLAQVAAFAHSQVAVRKHTDGERTRTEVATLNRADRVVELSRMLSGQPESGTARAHAEELLALGSGATSSTTTGGAVV